MRFIVGLAATAIAVNADTVVPVFNTAPSANASAVFNDIYSQYLADFPVESHAQLVKQIEDDMASYMQSTAFTGVGGPQCDMSSNSVALPQKMAAYPGGITKRVFGMNLAKLVEKLASKAQGAAGAQGMIPGLLAAQAVSTGAGLLKAAMHTAIQIVPKLLPPHQPLACLPMVTGHNCFGAIQYPITAADFVTASDTDSMLDGVIAGFPALYKRKVGSTSDSAYKACFSAYMGMHCASIFPRCSVPQADQYPSPAGRLPMCFTHCLATLVACPGLWIEDIAGECTNVSIPPLCSHSNFFNFWLLPPQYTTFESTLPTAQECPTVPESLKGSEASMNVYDDSSIMSSPYGSDGAAKLPIA